LVLMTRLRNLLALVLRPLGSGLWGLVWALAAAAASFGADDTASQLARSGAPAARKRPL